MSPHKNPHRLLITRFPLESAWGGEETLHLILAKSLMTKGVKTGLWSSCPTLLAGFRKNGFLTKRAYFSPDPTSIFSLLLFPITSVFLFIQGVFVLPYFRMRGFRTMLMLTFFEKILLTPLARLLGFRVIWAHHAPLEKWFFKNPLLPLWKRFQKYADIVVPSATEREKLKSVVPTATIHIVPNATPPLTRSDQGQMLSDLTRKKSTPESLLIGSCSRLSPEKKVLEMIHLAESFPEQTFLIAGDGPLKNELEEHIQQKVLKNIFLLGRLDDRDLADFYASLDIFISCSRYETFGISLAEAQQFGVPVVAPRVGGIPEVVCDQETGLLFSPEDIDDAKKKLRELINRPALRTEMGQAAKEHAQQFSPEAYSERMMKILFPKM